MSFSVQGDPSNGSPTPCPAATDLPAPGNAALFLDFDGTLVDIAPRPDAVVVPPRVADILSRAQDRLSGRVAIVSGRTVAELESFLPSFDGPLVGAHGAQVRLSGETRLTVDVDPSDIAALHTRIEDFAGRTPGLLAEPKPTGSVLHFRACREMEEEVRAFMESLASNSQGLKLQPAHCAFEIKPSGVGKDRALLMLSKNAPFEGASPVYAGDDLTDEPALAWVQDNGGIGIRIGKGDTGASHRLSDPSALLDLLEAWLA